jgi:hypothetical protein
MNAGHDDERRAGLLLLSAEGARAMDWRPGRAEELRSYSFDEDVEGWRELRGPSASHPRGSGEAAPAFRSGQQRDLFERRLEQHRVAFVRHVAADVVELARARGWRFVLVLGDPRLTHGAAEVLHGSGIEAGQSDRLLGWLTPHELALAVAPDLERAWHALVAGVR